ncbi:MAG: FixH family protein [Geminicoccaceae bacterium]
MMITAKSGSEQNQATAAGSWIPWLFVGLFMVVLLVNGTMVTIAISTFNGLETENAYKKGLAYNQRLAAAAEQERLGWQASLAVTPGGDNRVTLSLDLQDRLANPINAAAVKVTLIRPVQEGFDQTTALVERGDGRYDATIDLPLAGQWDVRLTADVRGETFRLGKRIHVKP